MKTKLIYKKIAPDLEKIKTDAIFKICQEALKKQAIKKSKGEICDAISKRI